MTISTTKEKARTKTMIFHIEPLIWSRASTTRAGSPPTSTVATLESAEAGTI
jgi:hypothetical protein